MLTREGLANPLKALFDIVLVEIKSLADAPFEDIGTPQSKPARQEKR